MRPSRGQLRAGLTLIELIFTIVLIGFVTAIAVPRLHTLKDQAQLSGATTRFSRAVMTARQAAIQRGRRSYFRHKNDSIWVIVDTTGNDSVIVSTPYSLTSSYGVEVTSPTGLSTIEFDPRGVAVQAAKKIFLFEHTSSGRTDSLCVSRLGNLIKKQCP